MLHILSTTIVLAGFWLLLSGVYTGLMFVFGAASIVFTVYLVRRMDVIDHESHPLHLTLAVPRYFLWLFGEIIKANIDVAKIVLSPKLNISPTMLEFKAHQKTELGRVIYANSITLTPGTIALRLSENGDLVVHALSKSGAEDLQSGDMDQRVSKMGMDQFSAIEHERGITQDTPPASPSDQNKGEMA